MSREIKFRAWDDVVEGFCYIMLLPGKAFQYQNDGVGPLGHKSTQLRDWQQFTGLKDKGGREIAEGDILRSDHQKLVAEVVWETPGFCLKDANGRMGDFGLSDAYRNGENCEYIEVIGNRFENPELLEAQHD